MTPETLAYRQGRTMRYSSFNWTAKRKRGWIFGPFRGRTLTITWEWNA